MNNGRVHNRAGADADAPALQILVHRVQHRPAQFVFLQQVTEPEDGALVRHRCPPQIDSHKAPQHRRFIQRILGPRIAQVEPLLQKVHPQHAAQAHRWPPVLSLRLVRLHQRLSLHPGHDLFHLFQNPLPLRLPRVLLEARLHRQSLLSHPPFSSTYTLPASPVDRRVLQRFPSQVILSETGTYDETDVDRTTGSQSNTVSWTVTTQPPPFALTGTATSLASSNPILHCIVNPNNNPGSAYFEGTTDPNFVYSVP